MAVISISITVLNPVEVVKAKKGAFTGLLAKLFMNEKKLKREVETKICEQIIQELREKIKEGLTKEGVVANVKYSCYDEDFNESI